MEDDIVVRKLIELIFLKKFQVTAEMTVKGSSFPPCLLVNAFPLKLRCVIILKQAVLYEVWRKGWPSFFDDYMTNVHSLTADYLKSILSACYVEHVCLNKPFDSFISVCAMVRVACIHISQKSEIDFSVLNTLIVSEFYDRVLKNSFLRCGGFQRFIRYINEHPYLKWKMDLNDETALDDPLGYFDPSIAKKLEKEKKKEMNSRSSGYARNLDIEDLESISFSMAQNVLMVASLKIISVADSHDPNRTDGAINLSINPKAAEEIVKMETTLLSQLLHDGEMNLNKEAKTAEGTMETEAALKSEPLDGGAMNLNEEAKIVEGSVKTKAALKKKPLDGGTMNLNEGAKIVEGSVKTKAAVKKKPLDVGAMNLNEEAKIVEKSVKTKAALKKKPLDGGAMNLNEEAKIVEGSVKTKAALKKQPLDGGAMNLNEKAKTTEGTKETDAALKSEPSDELSSHLRSNLDSKANHAEKQPEVKLSYERIVQAVIKHNRSKNSDLSDCDKQLLERANRILDRLQDRIKYLIELLDENDKE